MSPGSSTTQRSASSRAVSVHSAHGLAATVVNAPQRSQQLRGGDDEVSPPDTVATSPLRVDDPPSLDWSAQGAVSPVKDQGNCGSWYAFASVGAVESMHFIKAKYLQYLSEQQVVDCSGGYGNLGCKGGLMDNTYQYLIDHKVCRV